MKNLLLLAPAIFALGISARAEEVLISPTVGNPTSVQAATYLTFAVVIEVRGGLPNPTEYARARNEAIRIMQARGLVLTPNADQADCLATVIFEPTGVWRIILHLDRARGAVPADPDSANADYAESAPAPDVCLPGDIDPECFVDLSSYAYWPVGPWGAAGFYHYRPGREAFRNYPARDQRRFPANALRPLPTGERNFSRTLPRTPAPRASGGFTRPSPAPRTGARSYSTPPASRAPAARAPASTSRADNPSRR